MDPALAFLHSENTDYLKEERIRLLKELKEATISQRLEQNDAESLTQLRSQYNSLMDRIEDEESRRSPLFDPLWALPGEIWQEIITMSKDGTASNLWEVEHILPLTLVSTSWRRAILSTPAFWTYIQLFTPCDDMEDKVAMCLRLSSDLPLNICLQVSNGIRDSIVPILNGQGHRIKNLSLLQDYSTSIDRSATNPSQAETFVNMLLKIAGKMTALEEFCFYGTLHQAPPADLILRDATQLHTLECVKVSSESLQLESVKKLRRYVTYNPLPEVFPYLCKLEHLDQIGLLNESRFSTESPTAVTDTTKVDYEEETIPWKLNSLMIDNHPTDLGWSIVNETMSSLNYLRISIPWAKLPHFISASPRMARLSDLTMTLPISHDNDFRNFPSVIHKIPIQYLYLTIKADDYTLNTNEDAISGCQASAKRLGDALIPWAPDIERFSIYTPLDHAFCIHYVQSLSKLTNLTASRSSRSSTHGPKVELPSVKKLDVTGRTSLFSAFSYSNATDLSISNSEDYINGDFISVHESLGKHTGTWSNLTSIEFGTQREKWGELSLPRVKELTVGGMSQKGRYLSPSVLGELALKSDLLPSLSQIHMRWFPPWDLLFIMLERRNFSTNAGTVPITTVSFPSAPAPAILRPLISLLRGRITLRPSNFDLSLESMADTYFDANLSGCSLCHLAYFPCQDSSDFFSSRPPMYDLQTPPYPSNIERILTDCEERANWWSKNIQTLGERHWPCDRHNSFQLVAITGDCGDRENEISNVKSYELFDQTWALDESCSEISSSDFGSQ